MKANRILIYFHPTSSAQVSWIFVDENNHILQNVFNGDLNLFPTSTIDHDVFVFVPTESIVLTSVALPKLSRQRLLQALPFALEEQLIQEVDDLHFAVGDYQADNTWPVAVVARRKMENWLMLCAEIKVSPNAFIPSVFMLPYLENTWHINVDEDHALVRTGHYAGFACEKNNLDVMVELKLAEESDREAIQLTRTEIKEQTLLENLAAKPKLSYEINLLQGEYQPKPQTTQTKKIWILTGYLTIALVALGFFSQLMSFFILHSKSSQIETAINTIYKKNFPNARSVVAPRDRMNDKLHSLSGISNKQGLLLLLGQIGKGLSETKAIRIEHLEYREQQLTLEVSATEFANIDRFVATLTQEGLSVKQNNAATAGNQVKATLLIRQTA